jgi:putative FmdB family regulatory protein
MPFYEYQCKSCGHELEAMQKVSDPPLKKCPHCGKSQLQRLMSAPVFRLKGGGWYETDFKGDKDNQRNLADRAEDAPKDTKDAKDTDSKESDSKANHPAAAARKNRRQTDRRGAGVSRKSRSRSSGAARFRRRQECRGLARAHSKP